MRRFYKLEQEYDKTFYAEVDDKYEFDFWEEKMYRLPLEYSHKFKMKNGDTMPDFTYTNICSCIYSKKFKNLINEFVSQNEIEWIHLQVINKDNSISDAYYPRFIPIPHMFDVLDEERTILTDHGDIMIPYLSAEKTRDKHFIILLENQLYVYVSAELKKAIQKAKITGVRKFIKARMDI
ncbi:MAG: hypothetical protein CR967_04195 [Proteobacteria bacterium]|nr:MAG: hypothetical protein CR967_04195 [Pseudomonadota bacterium]